MADPKVTPIDAKKMHNWPGVGKVAKLLSKSIKQVNELIANGDLKAHDYNGERRFDPNMVDALAQDLLEVRDDDDVDLTVIQAKTKQESLVMHTISDVLREVRSQQRETQQHNIDLQKTVNGSYRALLESKDETIDRQSRRIVELETAQLEFLHAREAYLDGQEERLLERNRAETRNTITKDIWATTKTNFGNLMAAAMKKWGLDAASGEKMNAAMSLLQSVAETPTRLQVLIETGLVTEDEARWIRVILGMPEPGPEEPKSEASPASEDGQTDPGESSSTEHEAPEGTTVDVEPEATNQEEKQS